MKINKEKLKKKILGILDIAPYLYKNPEDIYVALLRIYPLKAIEICIKELKEEMKLETDEEFEWENE